MFHDYVELKEGETPLYDPRIRSVEEVPTVP